MSVKVQNTINKIQRRFIWGGPNLVRKLHHVSWNSIGNYRALGGLGLLDIALKSKVLLNKWLWRFNNEQESLWRKVLVGKLGDNHDSLFSTIANSVNSSRLWNNITRPLDGTYDYNSFVCDGIEISIGNGEKVSF